MSWDEATNLMGHMSFIAAHSSFAAQGSTTFSPPQMVRLGMQYRLEIHAGLDAMVMEICF